MEYVGVENYYHDPEYDPRNLPRDAKRRKKWSHQVTMRTMLPFAVRCGICSNFMAAGTKFYSRKEVLKERYLGQVKVHRLYQKCKKCSSEFTYRTDPATDFYVTELNCVRVDAIEDDGLGNVGDGVGVSAATAGQGDDGEDGDEAEREADVLRVLEQRAEKNRSERDDAHQLEVMREVALRRRRFDVEQREQDREGRDVAHEEESSGGRVLLSSGGANRIGSGGGLVAPETTEAEQLDVATKALLDEQAAFLRRRHKERQTAEAEAEGSRKNIGKKVSKNNGEQEEGVDGEKQEGEEEIDDGFGGGVVLTTSRPHMMQPPPSKRSALISYDDDSASSSDDD